MLYSSPQRKNGFEVMPMSERARETPGPVGELSPVEAQKRAAGRRAADYVEDGQIVGLGTGSTVRYFLEALAERIRQGLSVAGVPTSSGTESLARQLGIPLVDLDAHPTLDVAVDGADEIDPNLNLIKGLGAALVREKIVEASSRRLVIVGDEGKLVPVLGSRAPVPVAVIPFGWTTTQDRLARLGCRPVLRERAGQPVVTDDGLYIVDCWFGPMKDPFEVERRLQATVGAAATGLFLGWPLVALVGRADLSVTVLSSESG